MKQGNPSKTVSWMGRACKKCAYELLTFYYSTTSSRRSSPCVGERRRKKKNKIENNEL